jgi:Sulfatase
MPIFRQAPRMRAPLPRRPSAWRAALVLAACVLFLCLLFLPARDDANLRLVLGWRPEIEPLLLIALLALLALAGRRQPGWLRWLVAGLVLAASLLQLADAAVLGVFDRQLNLYFDLPHVPQLLGLFYDTAGPWRGTAGIAAVLVALAAAWALIAAALAAAERALRPPRHAAATLGLLGAVLVAAPVSGIVLGHPLLGERALPAIARQSALLVRTWRVMQGDDPAYEAALAAPQPKPGPLPGLKQHDVYLIFFESYGTVVLDNPRYAAAIVPALDRFAATVEKSGWHLVSDRIASPTFGGGSWLAHGTMDSGVKLDPLLTRLVTRSKRETLPRYMQAAGYRAVEIQPGLKTPEPGTGFWGFDATEGAAALRYHGPPFGWFTIPDQYTLERFDATDAAPGHKPLFAQIVLVSSHTPFAPVPPYVADWRQGDLYRGIAPAQWRRIYAPPDWAHLEQPFLDSVVYDLDTLAGWLARLPGDALVVILGDHQPPGFISGADQPWTVPIHVLSRDPDLLRPFRALGYVDGPLPPRRGDFKGMESFLGDYIRGFSAAPSVAASRPAATEHGIE